MYTLGINTAASTTSIILLKEESSKSNASKFIEMIQSKSWESHNDEAEKLMPSIDNLLKKQGLKYKDLSKIVVIKGPGSFTGLRVGVNTANILAYLTNTKVYPINTFQYWHAINEKTAVLVFAGKKAVYLSRPLTDKNITASLEGASSANSSSSAHPSPTPTPLYPPEIINLNDLQKILKSHQITEIQGDISDEQKELLDQIGIKYIKTQNNFEEGFCTVIKKLLGKNKILSQKQVSPLYVKKPNISISKKITLKI